jgi:hypothetical protein
MSKIGIPNEMLEMILEINQDLRRQDIHIYWHIHAGYCIHDI